MDVVFAQVDGGRELRLYPGLNIIGGMQPRGSSALMPPDILDVLDSLDIGGMVDIDDAGIEEVGIDDIGIEEVILVFVLVVMPEAGIPCLLTIDPMAIDELIEFGDPPGDASRPNPGPAWSKYSGRH